MGDSENAPPSKKRGAGVQLTKDNPEVDDDSSELETGTFKRASDEVLAARKIVKVRRTQPAAASSNPFASIRLIPPPAPAPAPAPAPSGEAISTVDKTASEEKFGANENTEKCGNGGENNKTSGDTADASTKVNNEVKAEVVEAEKEKENGQEKTDTKTGEETEVAKEETTNKTEEETKGKKQETEAIVTSEKPAGAVEEETDAAKTPVSSFKQLSSSQNAFTGLTGTGFGSSSFSFGALVKEGPAFGSSSESVFGFKTETQSFPSFGGGSSTNGDFYFQLPDSTKSGAKSIASLQEVPVETGEENERVVFTADAILYEYLDGGWKERGKGELKVNAHISDTNKARLVMRARGNYRLILNARIFPEMNLTNMDKKGITFACVNSAGDSKEELVTFALKFKDSSFVEEFRGVVTAHKGKHENVTKTPENSPKASDA